MIPHRTRTEEAGQFEPAHAGKLDIQRDERKKLVLQSRQRGLGRLTTHHFVATGTDDALEQHPRWPVILDHQNPAGC